MEISSDDTSAVLTVKDQAVVDNFQIFGPNEIPATVSFGMGWGATGAFHIRGKGSSVPDTSPKAFLGRLARAVALGHFSGSEHGFSFNSVGTASSAGVFAEMGTESNGVFLP